MDKTKATFNYVQNKFPVINEAKIKEGIYVGVQIGKLLLVETFDRVPGEWKRKLHGKLSSQWQPTFRLMNEQKITEN